MASCTALFLDIDLTLLPSMTTDVSPQQLALIFQLYEHLDGALAFVTGRSASSVDLTFPDLLPAAVEHHAGWRPSRGQPYIDRAQTINSAAIVSALKATLIDKVTIFPEKGRILQNEPGLYIEEKKYSLALVFPPQFSNAIKPLLIGFANAAIQDYGLSATHHVVIGNDAIEIGPRNAHKIMAVNDFMATPAFKGRKPVFIGDSLSDAQAMQRCAEEFGGYGIAVGATIPAAPFIKTRLSGIDGAWHFLNEWHKKIIHR